MEKFAKFVTLNLLAPVAMAGYYTERTTVKLMRKIAAHYGANINIHHPE